MSRLKFGLAGLVGAGLVRFLFTFTRLERIGVENYQQFRSSGTPILFVFWHGGLLPLIHYHRQEGIVVLTSEHRDGEYVTQIIQHHGFRAVRGSFTRGGRKGLRGLVRAARSGQDIALTPDGPRGPRGVFKPGSLLVAQIGHLPVVPISVTASSGWHLRSWDKFLIPRLSSTVRLRYHPPRFVGKNATRDELELIAADIEEELNAATTVLSNQIPGSSSQTPVHHRHQHVKHI
ncbi:MAG: lysophospholipid acyltransferase family protein [Gemmatimonadetes bacterium]|nr:lysophospholipid acyltransferase family protein [Gemmatimonadota bacterium]